MMLRDSRRLMMVTAALIAIATPAAAQDVRSAVDDLARSWRRGDAGSIAAAVSRSGASVEVEGDRRHGPLNARQVSAALRGLFDERETVDVRPGAARIVEGSAGRAYGELVWTARMRGTTQPQRATVFLALVLEDDSWRITEIRVLR